MSSDNNKQDDTDVLRAQDIVPPYNKEHLLEQNLPTTQADQIKDISSQKVQKQILNEEISSVSVSQTQNAEACVTGHVDVIQEVNEIPKFDLAEQIMAEQRKITAIRRKAPGHKTKAPDRRPRIESTGYAIEPPRALSEKELIIAEIVAKDIEKLYRGDNSFLQNC
ncbi:MAG: hypothetical protein GY774_31300 [Planctomycetes bacterium]|nr:hypothetical protein [Planctomycetota bacterium]